MAYQKVVIAGLDTARLTVLTEAEKMALLREMQETGSAEAREKLILGNLRLVLSVIQRFTGRGEDVDDLFQIGVIGLMKAIGAQNGAVSLLVLTEIFITAIFGGVIGFFAGWGFAQ